MMGGHEVFDWGWPRHNFLFVAAAPLPVIRHVRKIWPLLGTGDRLRDGTLHMTILPVFRGDVVDPRLVDCVTEALAEFRFPSFDITFDRMIAFKSKRKRPIVLKTPATNLLVDYLAQVIGHNLKRTFPNFPKPRKVTPHVTLAYGAGFEEKRFLPAPLRWRVRDIALIDSVQGEGRHIQLARWRLASH